MRSFLVSMGPQLPAGARDFRDMQANELMDAIERTVRFDVYFGERVGPLHPSASPDRKTEDSWNAYRGIVSPGFSHTGRVSPGTCLGARQRGTGPHRPRAAAGDTS